MSLQRISTEDLDKAIALHARWLETTGREGKRADFTGLVLNGKNLSRLDLRAAILRGAQLSWVNLSHTNLSEADLCGAVMNHAVLTDAILIGANLSGVNFRCADLTRAELTDSILIGVDMRGAIARTEEEAPREIPASAAKPAVVEVPASAGLRDQVGSAIGRFRKSVAVRADALTIFGRFVPKSLVSEQDSILKPRIVKTV